MGMSHGAALFYGVYWDMESPVCPDDTEIDLDEVVDRMADEAGVPQSHAPSPPGMDGDAYRAAWRAWDLSPERVARRQAERDARAELGCDFGWYGSAYSETGTYLYALGSRTSGEGLPSPVRVGGFNEDAAVVKLHRFVERFGLCTPTEGPGWFMAAFES